MEQQRIWDYFQGDEAGLASFRVAIPRYRFLADQVKHGEKVLNIGVGSGGLETLLHAKGVNICCLDPGDRAIALLRARLGLSEEQARTGVSQEIPFPSDGFDAVIMSEVLEHLDDVTINASLKEVRRVLNARGRFIGTVPADEKLAEGVVICPACGTKFHRWGHVQSFTRTKLTAILASEFARIEVHRTVFRMGEDLNWKGRIGWVLKRAAIACGIEGSGENWYFIAT